MNFAVVWRRALRREGKPSSCRRGLAEPPRVPQAKSLRAVAAGSRISGCRARFLFANHGVAGQALERIEIGKIVP